MIFFRYKGIIITFINVQLKFDFTALSGKIIIFIANRYLNMWNDGIDFSVLNYWMILLVFLKSSWMIFNFYIDITLFIVQFF